MNDEFPKPQKPTVVTFRGGPHDGSVHTDDELCPDVVMARFITFIYEEKGTVEVSGNFNFGSTVAHQYKLASVGETETLRTIVVDYDSHHRG